MIALARKLINIPIMSKVVESFTTFPSSSNIAKTNKEPINAETVAEYGEEKPKQRMPKATARLAPDVMPRIEGPARGFLKQLCSRSPQTPKAAPQNNAVIAAGTRDWSIMNLAVSFAASSPKIIFVISLAGMLIEPKQIFSREEAIAIIISNIIFLMQSYENKYYQNLLFLPREYLGEMELHRRNQ